MVRASDLQSEHSPVLANDLTKGRRWSVAGKVNKFIAEIHGSIPLGL